MLNKSTLYDDSPCGCLSFTTEGKILQINQTLLNWTGYLENELVEIKRLGDLLTVGGKLYYQMVLLPLLSRQGEISEMNFDILTKDGQFFPCLFNAVKAEYEGNDVINAVILKINDRKKLEADLQKAKRVAEEEIRRFETLSNVVPNPIFTMTSEGEVSFANKRFYDEFPALSTGFTKEQMQSLILPQSRKALDRKWNASVKKGVAFEAEIRFRNHSSRHCWYLVKIVPFRNSSGNIETWFGSFTDIHARKTKQLKELKLLNTSLTKARFTINDQVKTLDEISYSQSHVVRKPLANILGLLSLADSDDLHYVVNVLLPMMKVSAEELDTVIKSMIDASSEASLEDDTITSA